MTWGDADGPQRDRIRIHDIFPESDLPEIAEFVAAAHPHLELVAMENRPEDYAETLAGWADGLKANRDRAVQIVGADRYKFYLESCRGRSGSLSAPTLLSLPSYVQAQGAVMLSNCLEPPFAAAAWLYQKIRSA